MSCADPSTIDSTISPSWPALAGLWDDQTGLSPMCSLAREINAWGALIGRGSNAFSYIGATPTDGDLAVAAAGQNSQVYGKTLLDEFKAEVQAIVSANEIRSCKSWGWTSANQAAAQSALTGLPSTGQIYNWPDIVAGLREALEELDQQYFDGWAEVSGPGITTLKDNYNGIRYRPDGACGWTLVAGAVTDAVVGYWIGATWVRNTRAAFDFKFICDLPRALSFYINLTDNASFTYTYSPMGTVEVSPDDYTPVVDPSTGQTTYHSNTFSFSITMDSLISSCDSTAMGNAGNVMVGSVIVDPEPMYLDDCGNTVNCA